jgi:3-isopropylmalate dehydratase small subunit
MSPQALDDIARSCGLCLSDYGIRCVIAPSFGDIFSQNAAKNGLRTALLTKSECEALIAALDWLPTLPITVDLQADTIIYSNLLSVHFGIDAARRTRLLNGWDNQAGNGFRGRRDKRPKTASIRPYQ